MIGAALRGAGLAVLLLLAPASAGASGARLPVALTASPAHVELVGSGRTSVRVTNSGRSSVILDVRRAGFALDLRGRPRVVAPDAGGRSAAAWLAFRPRTLAIGPGRSQTVSIASRVPAKAEPGDHDALVLFTTRRRVREGLSVRVRMGVVVVIRAPGRVVRRLVLGGMGAKRVGRGRFLELAVTNRGNVTESFGRGSIVVSVERGGRRIARLIAEARSLRPGTRGLLRFPVRRRLIGQVVARVDLVSDAGRIQRVYRLRL